MIDLRDITLQATDSEETADLRLSVFSEVYLYLCIHLSSQIQLYPTDPTQLEHSQQQSSSSSLSSSSSQELSES